jgi:predicted amidohydrolase YtcJ
MTKLYKARTVHTLSQEAQGDTLAVEGDTIAAVGLWSEVRDRYPHAEIVELPDATLVPGLIDAHIHPIGGLDMIRGADLRECHTLQAVEERLRSDPAARCGEWILGWGLEHTSFPGVPTGDVLDRVAPNSPAVIRLVDAHSIIASSTALERAHIVGGETFADNSLVAVDGSGRPTGYLIEHEAMDLVLEHIPPMALDARVASLRHTLMEMARTGFTAGHGVDMGASTASSIELLEAASTFESGLALDLTMSPIVGPDNTSESLAQIVAFQSRFGDRWRVSGVKLFIDGTIDNGTAWLEQPDSHGESTKSLWLDPEAYAETVRFFDAAGIPTRTHAIGDKGIDYVVQTLASLPPSTLRHRIEHIETVTDGVLDRIAAAGIAASMQPTHNSLFIRADGSDNWSKRLGPERAGRGYRTRDIRDRGITLALGSDWPVVPSDARMILAAAQLRRQPGAPDDTVVGRAQGLTAWEALEGLTTHAADSIGAQSRVLKPGLPATFTAFEHDPLTTAPDVFASTSVVMTAIAGTVIVS